MASVLRRHFSVWAATALVGLSASAWADALPAPKGKVILSVSGLIAHTNAPDVAKFDLASLKALPQTSFSTMTPWAPKPVRFTGPLLRDVLKAVGANGTQLQAVALNDYKITIPVSDTEQFNVVLAHQMDGKPIPVREKGPLFIIYPFDEKPELATKTYYERAIWQLKSLVVQP